LSRPSGDSLHLPQGIEGADGYFDAENLGLDGGLAQLGVGRNTVQSLDDV
jgi:hypothetical protein